MVRAYLDIAFGSPDTHQKQLNQHRAVRSWLKQNHAAYGLPAEVADLDEVERETLSSCFSAENPDSECMIDEPASIVLGRIVFELSDASNLQKHTENFLTLCTGRRTLTKNKKSLCYRGTPLHRFVEDFVIQGGDVIKGDGSGGESIYGGTIGDPKPPHQPHSYGTLSFASSNSKNSSTSQYFICLVPTHSLSADGSPTTQVLAEGQKIAGKKLDGKFYPFGRVVEGWEVLGKLREKVGGGRWEKMKERGEKCWVEDCGELIS